jgi:hypothetical protein
MFIPRGSTNAFLPGFLLLFPATKMRNGHILAMDWTPVCQGEVSLRNDRGWRWLFHWVNHCGLYHLASRLRLRFCLRQDAGKSGRDACSIAGSRFSSHRGRVRRTALADWPPQ